VGGEEDELGGRRGGQYEGGASQASAAAVDGGHGSQRGLQRRLEPHAAREARGVTTGNGTQRGGERRGSARSSGWRWRGGAVEGTWAAVARHGHKRAADEASLASSGALGREGRIRQEPL
jgi:hypothetical protein